MCTGIRGVAEIPIADWRSITSLVAELKRCDQSGLITASIAMAFICIDSLANLARPTQASKVTRADFKAWVDKYLKAHDEQPYKYRGKDVYAARCAFLHTYGSEAELHTQDTDIKKFAYHNGGMHNYNPQIDPSLVIIGTRSFVNDVIIAIESFIEECGSNSDLKIRVEQRLIGFLHEVPISQ